MGALIRAVTRRAPRAERARSENGLYEACRARYQVTVSPDQAFDQQVIPQLG